ncbi:hypothetical protein Pcar_2511 [Syntrophotalea carbinolica DSM 2380]|uniref:Uncharacterized protein n=1 Tax=Syntrophotalea carbinolica (strain DSM 2380 / NBRC 103641 / GraBd1) TaxID=338963 RepID=Q3A1K8_SYNC1|nr:hypothetical protein Pcar_2511 [Syntrophotalea carbinolica DSM 2380]
MHHQSFVYNTYNKANTFSTKFLNVLAIFLKTIDFIEFSGSTFFGNETGFITKPSSVRVGTLSATHLNDDTERIVRPLKNKNFRLWTNNQIYNLLLD